ncbi:MAG: alginate O-acetyltransferase [Pseudomonas sp.]|uniref:alginate O-acetyltransferase n=1 Tax=Pseudomonas sp. TaxID=306 RepID=UPI003392DD9A
MTLKLRLLYVGLFMGLLLGLGAWSVRSFGEFSAPPDGKFLQGQWAKAFETHYDKEFPIKRLGTNLWAALDYQVFGEGRPGVVLGREDWLYSDEEFKPVANAQQHIQDNWALIEGVRNRLAEKNIKLVLAILPAKARLYPEYIGETVPATLHGDLFQAFQARARQAGVLAPDLLGPLQQAKLSGDVFLRTDTHWTPRGAEVVAQQLSAVIRREAPLAVAPQAFVTESVGEQEAYQGDLVTFLPLDPLFSDMLPAPDQVQVRKTRAAEEGAPQSDDALFGETQVPLALVGTSYSANARWNFAGALRQALGSDLVNHAEDGKGPVLPMLKYLQSDDLKNAAPQVVIWEFPERYLPVANDLSSFDPNWIAQLKKTAPTDQGLASLMADPSTSSIMPTRAQQ